MCHNIKNTRIPYLIQALLLTLQNVSIPLSHVVYNLNIHLVIHHLSYTSKREQIENRNNNINLTENISTGTSFLKTIMSLR